MLNRAGVFIVLCLTILFYSCSDSNKDYELIVPSPHQELRLYFAVNEGEAYYLLMKGEIIVGWSKMEVKLNDGESDMKLVFEKMQSGLDILSDNLFDHQVLNDKIRKSNIAEFILSIKGNPTLQLEIQYVVFDEGIAFRYKIPAEYIGRINILTHLVLHNKNNAWRLINKNDFIESAAPLIDTVKFPATFLMGNKMYLNVDCLNSDTNQFLLRTETKLNDYSFANNITHVKNGFGFSSWFIMENVDVHEIE